MDMQDWELLRAYANTGSEESFTELVNRHVGLVYSAALRQVNDPHLAQEVTQRTFCLLAEKASSLSRHTALIGWLFRTAWLVASETRRAERRRRAREEKAAQMNYPETEADGAWEQLSPMLDEALNHLGDKDRFAVLQRFFQQKTLCEVGETLGVSEEAAKMRVTRAIEKLRRFFATKGAVCPTATLLTLLTERTVHAAPVGLAKLVGVAAASKAAAVGTSVPALLKLFDFMANVKLKTVAVAGVCLLIGIDAGLYLYNREQRRRLTSPQGDSGDRAQPAASSVSASRSNVQARAVADSSSDSELAQAITNLRAVLHEPWGSRRFPEARLTDALSKFGANRKAATGVLLEALKEINMGVQVGASFGLQQLGTDAAEAVPALLELLKANRLAVLNDGIPKTFAAIHPGADLVPDLIAVMRDPALMGRGQVAQLIVALVNGNPGSEATYDPQLTELLRDSNQDVRLEAARALANFRGEKDPLVVSELIDALNLPALRDPTFYGPFFDKESNTTYMREGEKMFDSFRRVAAVSGLKALGADAKQAVPWLEELAQRDEQLRQAALEAIGANRQRKAGVRS